MNLDCKECSMQTALDCSQYHPGSLNELLYERKILDLSLHQNKLSLVFPQKRKLISLNNKLP